MRSREQTIHLKIRDHLSDQDAQSVLRDVGRISGVFNVAALFPNESGALKSIYTARIAQSTNAEKAVQEIQALRGIEYAEIASVRGPK